MWAPDGSLLSRYLQGVKVIASRSPLVAPSDESHTPASHGQDFSVLQYAFGVRGLLQRQAAALVDVHESVLRDDGTPATINFPVIKKRLDDAAALANSRFYIFPYYLVPAVYRELYTDNLILLTYHCLINSVLQADKSTAQLLDYLVEKVDRTLITSGGAGSLGKQWIEETLNILKQVAETDEAEERPQKRRKTLQDCFSTDEPFARPVLSPTKTCPRRQGLDVVQFEDYMNSGHPRPLVFTDLTPEWPALTDRPWKSVQYLLSQTIGGRRLVPVEIGRSYVDQGWGQELIQFKTFLERYVLADRTSQNTGYLAQHNLFDQIPSLRNDITIPDFCWADVPGHPTDPCKDQPKLESPQLNAWFGPAKTITPLHTDGYHNLLCQVVGTKYVRLYPPEATSYMKPRAPEHGVDMSNTSSVDIGVVEGWDEMPDGGSDAGWNKEKLQNEEYWECVLRPGDTLLIPIGWWHYVRSLSVSFSVSFWWN